jgi:hypothetical protein
MIVPLPKFRTMKIETPSGRPTVSITEISMKAKDET